MKSYTIGKQVLTVWIPMCLAFGWLVDFSIDNTLSPIVLAYIGMMSGPVIYEWFSQSSKRWFMLVMFGIPMLIIGVYTPHPVIFWMFFGVGVISGWLLLWDEAQSCKE